MANGVYNCGDRAHKFLRGDRKLPRLQPESVPQGSARPGRGQVRVVQAHGATPEGQKPRRVGFGIEVPTPGLG